MILLDYFGATDAGKVRPNNEDSLLLGGDRDQALFAVADGMGGHRAGEVASSIVVEALRDLGPEDSLEGAIRQASRRILETQGDERFAGMGTTAVTLRYRQLTSFFGTGIRLTAEVAHVGDSRAYLLRDGLLVQVTEDHSLVAELVKNGSITRAQAANHPRRNVLTRALGDGEAWADSVLFEVRVGDRMLLCSDGLSDVVPEEDIARVLRSSARDPEVAARKLVEAALEAGGPDNVSVVVVDVRAFVPAYRHRNGAAQRAVYLSAEPGESESIANPEKTRTLRRVRAERTRIPSVSVRGSGLISAGEEARPGVGG